LIVRVGDRVLLWGEEEEEERVGGGEEEAPREEEEGMGVGEEEEVLLLTRGLFFVLTPVVVRLPGRLCVGGSSDCFLCLRT
jgi:hypothetical protein